MENTVGQTGIRQPPQRSGSRTASSRVSSEGKLGAILLAIVALLLIASVFAGHALSGSPSGNSPGAPLQSSPGITPVTSVSASPVGAPAGYGLTNPSALQAHGPILIDGNGGFVSANGVRSGNGTYGNPYVISNWLIDASKYSSTDAMIDLRNTTKYVVVENNRITNLSSSYNWEGIQLGLYPYICPTTNVVIRHNEVQSRTAYGIALREGASNVRVEANLVKLNAARNWTYGIMTDRNVRNITFYGNYVNAYTSSTLLTVGIQVGDYQVTPDRPASLITTERNTVTNATSQGIMSDDTRNYTVRYNRVYNNYPGYKKVPTWTVRGIMIEEISNGTLVYGNDVSWTENAIEVASGYGRYFSNTVHDSTYAIYVNYNNAFKEARNTVSDTLYDTTYWNVGTPFQVPSNSGHTILDVGSGVTPSNFASIYLMANQSRSQIGYAWYGNVFNVSMRVGSRLIYDHQTSTVSENVSAVWSGSNLQLTMSQFVPSDILCTLQSTTSVSFRGADLEPAAYYQILHAGALLANLTTDVGGNLSYGLPSPVSSSYEVRYVQSVPTPSLSIAQPLAGTYLTSPSIPVAWTASDPGPGLASVTLALDGGTAVDVTTVSSYLLTGVPDGRHVVGLTATDTAGLSVSRSVSFIVDTQPPVVTILSPRDQTNVTTPNLVVTWNATDATAGIASVTFRLDSGPAAVVVGSNYSVGGLTLGTHSVSVSAVDNAGLTATATAGFTVLANASSTGANGSAPAVAEVTYVPSQSAVDIAFTQPMNQTSVEQSLQVSPDVNYSVQWVDDAHVRLVINASLVPGEVYQVTLRPTAQANSGAALSHPFLFQFLAGGTGGANSAIADWVPLMLIVAILLIINWATAGLLVIHYRKNATRVRSAFGRLSARYRGSLVIVYKRLAAGTRRRETPSKRVTSKVPVKVQRSSLSPREVKTVRSPFSRRKE